jgi:hypothetical protein
MPLSAAATVRLGYIGRESCGLLLVLDSAYINMMPARASRVSGRGPASRGLGKPFRGALPGDILVLWRRQPE